MFDSLAIFGPPGTGKTHRLTQIIQDYGKDQDLSNMIVLAFSKAAARELVSRIPSKDIGFIGTIHSFCFRLLKLTRSDVVKVNDFYKIIHLPPEIVDASLNIYGFSLRTNRSLDDAYTHLLESGTNVIPLPIVEFVVESYVNWKNNNLLYDFEDMLRLARVRYEAGNGQYFKTVVIDEAQDLAPLQWDVVNKISTKSMIFAGDDDQAIFEWSGADPHGMSLYSTKSVVLDQSHRIPAAVHRVAEKLIKSIKNRVEKEFKSTNNEGYFAVLPRYNHEDHPEGHMVLCRDKFIMGDIAHHLVKCGVSYRLVGANNPGLLCGKIGDVVRALYYKGKIKEKFKPWMVKYIDEPLRTDLEHYCNGMTDTLPQFRWTDVVNAPPLTIMYLSGLGSAIFSIPQVNLATIHSQKGREFDHVVIIGDSSPASCKFVDSEIRVWYVAITRAKKGVTFVNPHSFLNITTE